MFVETNENFMICLITIVTFKFLDYNVKILFDLVINNKNNRRIIILSFLFK